MYGSIRRLDAAVDREAWDEVEQLLRIRDRRGEPPEDSRLRSDGSTFRWMGTRDTSFSRDGRGATPSGSDRHTEASAWPSLDIELGTDGRESWGAGGRDATAVRPRRRRSNRDCASCSTSRTSTPRWPNSTPCTRNSRTSNRRRGSRTPQVEQLICWTAFSPTVRWDELGALFADDLRVDDRRRGIRREYSGRANAIAESQAMAELGVANITSSVIADAGDASPQSTSARQAVPTVPAHMMSSSFGSSRSTSTTRSRRYVTFDIDDIDAAFDELDARYLAGEAAAHAHTWSVITQAYVALNRHEMPAMAPQLRRHRPSIACRDRVG